MCGIAGAIKRRDLLSDKDKQEIDAMLSMIYHRGPDDTGACGISDKEFENQDHAINIKRRSKGILGFNRLSIQDLSAAGHQPMLSDDKSTAITFNGEIYNVKHTGSVYLQQHFKREKIL